MQDDSSRIVANWHNVMKAIDRAAGDFERDPGDVALVCVSKTCQAEAILPVLAAGQRLFGENRVQEATSKWPALRDQFPDIQLHLIGPLQTNKVREAVELFDVIETLDRPKLAAAVAAEVTRTGRRPELFVQINTGAEDQKAGVLPEFADTFIAECRQIYELAVSGLMCIPPANQHASAHFAFLAQIARRNGIAKLSMGMSSDFELGIQLGATHVRIGSAIFGARAARDHAAL